MKKILYMLLHFISQDSYLSGKTIEKKGKEKMPGKTKPKQAREAALHQKLFCISAK